MAARTGDAGGAGGAAVRRQAFPGGLSISESVVVSGPGSWIHLSGQVPTDDAGAVVGGSMREQASLCFGAIAAALAKVGAGLSDIVKITVFLTDLSGLAELNEVRTDLLGDHAPASTAVEVAALFGGAALEIEAVAFKAEQGAG